MLSHLARSSESACGMQSTARKVQGEILAHEQGKRVGTVLSLAGEWMRGDFLSSLLPKSLM